VSVDRLKTAPVIPTDDNEMIVNTSDTFTRWTNGNVTAGIHQVNVPPRMADVTTGSILKRYSSVFFIKAHRRVSVSPFDHFVTEKGPAMYPNITALQFHRKMTDILY
jgi:isopenicillin N synthase-like dioxygenase